MYLALFLHLYQPPTQFARVLKSITHASYERLLNSIRKYPSARVTLNVSASLTEQLAADADLRGLIADLADLAERGQIELTGSAAYHPLLTEIPREEIRRQILLNDAINRQYLGEVYQPRGFFPPEMAVNRRVLRIIEELGFKWVIVDGSALAATGPAAGSSRPTSSLPASGRVAVGARRDTLRPRHPSPRLGAVGVFIRNTDLSVKIAFSQIRTVEEFLGAARPWRASNLPVILAMDGETFGHHRPEQFKFLEELFGGENIELVTLSQAQKLIGTVPDEDEVEIRQSSWGPWERWKNPKNPIHNLQWQLTTLAIEAVRNSNIKSQMSNLKCQKYMFASGQGKLTPEQKRWCEARKMLDRALHSDQYWWASAKPCWHYQMVKRGAKMLLDVVLTVPDASEPDKKHARDLYDKIIGTGLDLYGDCVIE